MKTGLLPLLLAASMTGFAQNPPYYYADSQRVYLHADTTAIYVKFRDLEPKVPFDHRVQLAGARTENTRYPSVKKIYLDPAAKNAGLADLRANQEIAYSWQALTVGGDEPIIPTGEIIVMPKPGGTSISALVKKLGLDVTILEKDPLLDGAYKLTAKSDDQLFSYANALYESGEVLYATPNFWLHIANDAPNDPLFSGQTWLENTVNPLIDINVEGTWHLTTNNVKVAVMDDGIAAHPDFPPGALQTGWAPRNPGGGGLPNYSRSGVGHGQSVAGIIMAKANNNLGVAGTYQGPCQLYSINIFWDGLETTQDVANAFNYARLNMNVDVINGSWNYTTPGVSFDNVTTAFQNASIYGRDGKGIPIIHSSGNDVTMTNLSVRYPASHYAITSVGAIDDNGVVTFFSCRGPELDLVALGDLASVLTTDLPGTAGGSVGDYRMFDGTSAAAPMVTGIVAGMLSIAPSISSARVRSAVTSGARDLGPFFLDNDYGWGLVNGCAAVAAAVTYESEIVGPQFIFGNGGEYTITNFPSHLPLTVTWNVGGTGQATVTNVTPNGSTCRVTPTADGQMGVSAVIHGICDEGAFMLFLPTVYIFTMMPLAKNDQFILSPVPATSNLTVKVNEDVKNKSASTGIREVSIFDKTGQLKLVRRFPSGQRYVTIDVSQLPQDMYVIKVDDGSKTPEKFARQVLIGR